MNTIAQIPASFVRAFVAKNIAYNAPHVCMFITIVECSDYSPREELDKFVAMFKKHEPAAYERHFEAIEEIVDALTEDYELEFAHQVTSIANFAAAVERAYADVLSRKK